jgi:hypothetical protein
MYIGDFDQPLPSSPQTPRRGADGVTAQKSQVNKQEHATNENARDFELPHIGLRVM